MKSEFKSLQTGWELVEAVANELSVQSIPPTDSAIVQEIKRLRFMPMYPRAEFFVSDDTKTVATIDADGTVEGA